MRKLKRIAVFMFMLITPVLTIPRMPQISKMSVNVKLPTVVEESVRKYGADSVKNMNINFGKFNFIFK